MNPDARQPAYIARASICSRFALRFIEQDAVCNKWKLRGAVAPSPQRKRAPRTARLFTNQSRELVVRSSSGAAETLHR